ncbi:quercetin 2,3-dioxygenase [Xylaria arbuscula]|nr:quercetin 2,3-dioxygenase [Xylaria arbuscula]
MVAKSASLRVVVTVAAAAVASAAKNIHAVSKLPVEGLYVERAPDHLRPYIFEHLTDTRAVNVSSQIYRFAVTGPSSDNAFTLISTDAPRSDALGKDDGEDQSRILAPGDYGSVVRNTTHTFQILDPDTELTGVIVPGGFEELFYTLGDNFTSGTNTPYVPAPDLGLAGPDSGAIGDLESFDVYAQLDFEPRRDLVNDTAPAGTVYGEPGEPYFVANGYGPKTLNSQFRYQVVQPLATQDQSRDLDFSISTISINKKKSNVTIPEHALSGASAFQVLEGLLSIEIGEYEPALLGGGDVAFIPPGMSFRYWSNVAFTKVLYVGKGDDSVDNQLIAAGEPWEFTSFPTY